MYYSKSYIKNYLNNHIKKSIENDVGIAIKAYSDHWLDKNEGTGFFAVPRLLFPEIDGLGAYITGNALDTGNNIKKYLATTLSKIDTRYADYAGFIALIYRNGLLHQHEPKRFRYKGRQIGWAFQVGSTNLPVEALRKSHLRMVGNNLWIHTNVFFQDVIKSIDEFTPSVMTKYKANFNKSHREQLKNLYSSSSLTRKYISSNDFRFLDRA